MVWPRVTKTVRVIVVVVVVVAKSAITSQTKLHKQSSRLRLAVSCGVSQLDGCCLTSEGKGKAEPDSGGIVVLA